MLRELQELLYRRLDRVPTDIQEQIIAGVPAIHSPRQSGFTDGIIIRAIAGAMIVQGAILYAPTAHIRRRLIERVDFFAEQLGLGLGTLNNIIYSQYVDEGEQVRIGSLGSVCSIENNKYYYDAGKYYLIDRLKG